MLPVPRSLGENVYDYVAGDVRFTTHKLYIDTVFIAGDLQRLLLLTAMFVPNEAFANIVVASEDIDPVILKSLLFEDLLWCESLVSMVGQTITSLNGETWEISVNVEGFPCFTNTNVLILDTSCVTKCDILVNNGIAHELGSLMVAFVDDVSPSTILLPQTATVITPSPSSMSQPSSSPLAMPAQPSVVSSGPTPMLNDSVQLPTLSLPTTVFPITKIPSSSPTQGLTPQPSPAPSIMPTLMMTSSPVLNPTRQPSPISRPTTNHNEVNENTRSPASEPVLLPTDDDGKTDNSTDTGSNISSTSLSAQNTLKTTASVLSILFVLSLRT